MSGKPWARRISQSKITRFSLTLSHTRVRSEMKFVLPRRRIPVRFPVCFLYFFPLFLFSPIESPLLSFSLSRSLAHRRSLFESRYRAIFYDKIIVARRPGHKNDPRPRLRITLRTRLESAGRRRWRPRALIPEQYVVRICSYADLRTRTCINAIVRM